jgi:hypothetical protein
MFPNKEQNSCMHIRFWATAGIFGMPYVRIGMVLVFCGCCLWGHPFARVIGLSHIEIDLWGNTIAFNDASAKAHLAILSHYS